MKVKHGGLERDLSPIEEQKVREAITRGEVTAQLTCWMVVWIPMCEKKSSASPCLKEECLGLGDLPEYDEIGAETRGSIKRK